MGVEHFAIKPISESVLHDAMVDVLLRDDAIEIPEQCRDKIEAEDQDLSSLRGANILLVEDSPLNREVAMAFLQKGEMHIDVATNGVEAVEKVVLGNYQLVLMDIQMPEMDGITATRRIRSHGAHKHLPIIAMTAHGTVGDYQKSLDAGMNDHITKPIDSHLLFSLLIKWVGWGNVHDRTMVHHPQPEKLGPLLQLDGIDTAQGLKNNMNMPPFYLKILRMFQAEYHDAADRITSHVGQGAFPSARMIAHSVKSAAKVIGAEELSTRAFVLELLLAEEKTQTAPLVRFEKELRRIMRSLDHLPEKNSDIQTGDGAVAEDFYQHLDQLEVYLRNHDVKAESVLEVLAQLPVSATINKKIANLIESVEDVEYEKALFDLGRLKVAMEAER